MKIVVAPDSFKGSLSAEEAGSIMRKALEQEIPGVEVVLLPMADGGEGTLDALLFATAGERIETKATGPLGEQVKAAYGILGDGKTAVVEIAQVAGLTMVPENQRNPTLTTTYGVGELICAALERGCREFIIGLGGSATNDGGLGMLQALGATFTDKAGQAVKPVGASLSHIAAADFSTLRQDVHACRFRVASDVKNPLCGENGASAVYGPQKGATEAQVQELDAGLAQYARLVEEQLQRPLQEIPGAGAAGGLGFGFLALGAEMASGAEVVAEAVGLEQQIRHADWVLTGEGQSDAQTLFGKAPFYVASLATKHDVGTILVSGSLGKGHERLLDCFVSCHATVNAPMPLEQALAMAEPLLYSCVRNIARLLSITNG